jgi:DNA-binding transcriptional ArsR family regulator
MNAAPNVDAQVSRIASAIGEPARTRILYCLMDGRARSSTELAVVSEVSPATASVHLNRLREEKLIKVLAQGKHRYYSLQGPEVAAALEGLSALATGSHAKFVPTTPNYLRAARTCYDHIAGTLGVQIHDRLRALDWLAYSPTSLTKNANAYDLTHKGTSAIARLGIDVQAARMLRRRFACACLDWSERTPHVGGAMGAALLKLALKRKWVMQDLDSRALSVTHLGRREFRKNLGVQLQ